MPVQLPRRTFSRLAGQGAALWVLLLALGLAPLLGQVHRTLHGGGAPKLVTSTAISTAIGTADDARAQQHAGHGLDRLFGTHGDASECRLYDQLGHADLLPGVPALSLPVLLPAFFIAFLQGEAVARFAALFDARGPPPFR